MAEHAEAPHEVHAHPNYLKVYWTLLALLCVSVIGPMFGIRAVTIITAFGVAIYKAYLVAKNFMHINVEKRFVPYIVMTALVFMLLFFAGTAPDVMKLQGTGWEKPSWKAANAAAHEGGEAGHHGGGAH